MFNVMRCSSIACRSCSRLTGVLVRGDQLLPQRNAHGRAVMLAPAKKGRACASGLLGQLDGKQVEGMPARLWQHLSLCQGNQLVAHGEALAGPGLKVPPYL
jgi:hypothetical protein